MNRVKKQLLGWLVFLIVCWIIGAIALTIEGKW